MELIAPISDERYAYLRAIASWKGPHRNAIEGHVLNTLGVDFVWVQEAQAIVQQVTLWSIHGMSGEVLQQLCWDCVVEARWLTQFNACVAKPETYVT